MVKDKTLIVSENKKGNIQEYIIKRKKPSDNDDVKLSNVFNELPAGVVHKDETGMGATTLELNTKRNSIIVEPIRVTAFSKAEVHGALCVAGKTNGKDYNSNNDILNYLNDDTKKPKKNLSGCR